tara:strand:- start:1513 stop:1713 length:201 start_codon:yes stop_codon:yes gene_type:complete
MWPWWKAKKEIIDEQILEEITSFEDEVTDEIVRGLWTIKEELDLPTEEVQVAVDSRIQYKSKRKNP